MRKIWLALAIILSCSPVAAKTWFLPDYQYGIEPVEKCASRGLRDNPQSGIDCTPITVDGITCYECKDKCTDLVETGQAISNCPYGCAAGKGVSGCPGLCYECKDKCTYLVETGQAISNCPYDCAAGKEVSDCPGLCYECKDECTYLVEMGQAISNCTYGCATGKSVANCPGLCYECKDKCTYLVETEQAISNCPYGCVTGKEVSGCPGLCYECKDKCTDLVETGQAISNCPYGCATGKEVSGCPGLCYECKPETPLRCYEHVNPNKYVLTHQCAINGKGDGYICNKVGENAGVDLPANCTIDEFANACSIVGDDSRLEDEAYFQGVNIGCPHGCEPNDPIGIMKAGCTLCNYCTDCSYMNNGKKATDEYSNCVPDSDPIKLIKEYCPANTSDKCGDATYPFRKGAWYIPSIGEMLDLSGMNISKMTPDGPIRDDLYSSDGSILNDQGFNYAQNLDEIYRSEIDRFEYMTAESLYKIEAELITLHELYNEDIDGGVTPLVYEEDKTIPGWTIYGSLHETLQCIDPQCSDKKKFYYMAGGHRFLTSTDNEMFAITLPYNADANLPGDLPEILKRKARGGTSYHNGGSGRIRPMISLTGSTDNNTMLPGVGNTVFYKNDNSEDRVSFISVYGNSAFQNSYDKLKAEFGDPVGVVSSAIINETDMTYDVRIIALKNSSFSNILNDYIAWPKDLSSRCLNVYPIGEDDTRELSRCYIALKGGNWLNIIPNE